MEDLYIGDEQAIIAYGYPNANGDIITRKAAEDMAIKFKEKYPMYDVYFNNTSEDGSKGFVTAKRRDL